MKTGETKGHGITCVFGGLGERDRVRQKTVRERESQGIRERENNKESEEREHSREREH